MISGTSQKIVLVIASLGAGGAERVMSLLAGEWARRGTAVTLITLSDAKDDHYKLHSAVRRIALDVMQPSSGKLEAFKNNVGRMGRLRAAIRAEHPDAVISFMDATNVLTLMATAGLRVPVIVSERIDPRHYPIAKGWEWLRRHLYRKATAVIVQTESVGDWARQFVPGERVQVIPNPVEIATTLPSTEATHLPQWLPADDYILAMGRLDTQKGFDLLLQAFAKLPQEFDAVKLIIVGEGAERLPLENLIRELNLNHRVLMPGRIDNPSPVMARARCFVLSSRYEGFPNALLEAMAAGTAVISFNCPSGPEDIITHEQNGLLVDPQDIGALADAMSRLLADDKLRENLARAATVSIQKYSLETITDKWQQIINETTT